MEKALPIDPYLEQIRNALRSHNALVIQAPPGAGKTLRVPPLVVEETGGQVWVSQPRRLAARLAARRAAELAGTPVGTWVGYQVRFEKCGGRRTCLWYVTEGVLVRRLVKDPDLAGVGAVILDEFHERRLDTDLALALLKRLQQKRPALRLIVMSATLEVTPVARFLGDCPVFQIPARSHELEIIHTPYSPAPLEQRVREAFEQLLASNRSGGDVLVFLPGAAEIRRAARACRDIAERAGYELAVLHGDLPAQEQDRAVQPGPRPKLILSTNVAESSVTIEGVRAVIDSGLARVPEDSPESGLPMLMVRRVSKASVEQRAGRAGRLGPGRVIRLYPLEDYLRRPDFEVPEILRRELSPLLLQLHAAGYRDPAELDWLVPPPTDSVAAAQALLRDLGAIASSGNLTEIGARMAQLPLHPRLARLVVEAERRHILPLGCAAAAVLEAWEGSPSRGLTETGTSDVLARLDQPWPRHIQQVYRQLLRLAGSASPERLQHDAKAEEQLLISTLAAFPDRVALRRSSEELIVAGGQTARLSPESVVRTAQWLVVIDLEKRTSLQAPLVRVASAIEPDWLLELFPDRIDAEDGLQWNPSRQRVELHSALRYRGLTLIEQTRPAPPSPEAAAILAEEALAAGVHQFVRQERLESFLARVEFAARLLGLPAPNMEDVASCLRSLCSGLVSFEELRERCARAGFERAMLNRLDARLGQALDRLAPEEIVLPSGRRARIDYRRNGNPRVSGQIQEFFGLDRELTIAGGQVPLVIELLAPNRRPVQATTHLGNFWRTLYPELRRQLARRYPKHAWPEDPLRASPQRFR